MNTASTLKTAVVIALASATFGAFAQGTTTTSTTVQKSETTAPIDGDAVAAKAKTVKHHVKTEAHKVAAAVEPAPAKTTTKTSVQSNVDAKTGATSVTSSTTATTK